ncbi:MAG TPA: DUF2911 domain-containing protein [Bryobacteraceae bacterium]|nr:DUF2911 domain-containing protein [Bryobacteraceae bacterium]
MRIAFPFATAALVMCASLVSAQSPPATETATIGGKTITIKYAAPSVRGRKIFGEGGRVSQDPTFPVWRAGANSATSLHTDADLDIGGLNVLKGDYTLFVLVKDPNAWELIVNKQTGQWGLTYNQGQDLGRVKMNMSKPASPVETLKYTLSSQGGNKGKLELAWENHVASVPITVK